MNEDSFLKDTKNRKFVIFPQNLKNPTENEILPSFLSTINCKLQGKSNIAFGKSRKPNIEINYIVFCLIAQFMSIFA